MRRSLPCLALVLATGLGAGVAAPTSAVRADEAADGAAARPAGADVLVLRDGRRLEGEVVAETPEAVTFRSGGSTRLYERAAIERVEHGAPPAGQPAPEAGGAPGAGGSGPGAPAPSAAPGRKPGKGERAEFGKKGKVLTEDSRRWVEELAARAVSEDEQVRRSIAAALRALGPVAAPSILDAAARSTSPSAQEFLRRVAAELGPKRDAPGSPAPEAGMPPSGQPGQAPAPEGGATPPAPGGDTRPGPGPAAGRPGRGAVDRLLADLELREEQRPRMQELLGGLERRQMGLVREIRSGALAPADAAARIDALRAEVLASAKSILDEAQYDLFEDHAQRYFDGLLARAARGGDGKAPPPPGGEAPQKQ